MNQQFMLDIETSEVDQHTGEVLQIAIIEMTFGKDGIWHKGRKYNFFQHTDNEPKNEFAKKHLQGLYEHCQSQPFVPIPEVREQILSYLKDCGAKSPNIFFAGWNVGLFDLPYLSHHGYLKPAMYVDGVLTGDCHYRVYEMSGALQLVANMMGETEVNPLIKESIKRFPPPKNGNRHDAMFDCERQVNIINGLLEISKDTREGIYSGK